MFPQLISKISRSSNFAIYGAQVVAYGVYVALRALRNIKPECFIVSKTDGNLPVIDDIPVRELNSCGLDKDTLVLVAVTELLQDDICGTLDSGGFHNYIRIDAQVEHLLMSAYFDSINKFPLLMGAASDANCDLAVYEVKCHRDKPLTDVPALKQWERSIQAGAGITDLRIVPLLDNTGDNISAKNKMYCEMTATYWVWKNTAHDWKGICHYRRHLEIDDKQIAMLADSDIDAVLPLPYLCYPNAFAQFRRFVSEAVADALHETLKALHPEKYETYLSILNGQYQYTYNLLIARREVFDDYCAWAFEVLGYMERLSDKVPEIAATRALSYVAEVVTSLYFLSNTDGLNIRHVGKRIYC